MGSLVVLLSMALVLGLKGHVLGLGLGLGLDGQVLVINSRLVISRKETVKWLQHTTARRAPIIVANTTEGRRNLVAKKHQSLKTSDGSVALHRAALQTRLIENHF